MITNTSDVSLALAVWLLHSEYDHIDQANYISATALMKPLRHIVLAPRVPKNAQPQDVESFIPSALGNSIHDSVEKAWTKGYAKSLRLLGYPEDLIERIRINPSDDEVRGSNSIIPVYLEQRLFREVELDGITYTVGGKFDMITDGVLQDMKSTTSFTWLKGGKDDDYILQKSIYRWLDAGQPLQKITEDYGRINFIFTDWQRAQAKQNPLYPQSRVRSKDYALWEPAKTEEWIRAKLRMIRRYADTPEALIPPCSDEELWRSEPAYKYYADPAKATVPGARSTRNFDTPQEANAFLAQKAKGVVVTVPGEPKRCAYCPAFPICTQRERYFPS